MTDVPHRDLLGRATLPRGGATGDLSAAFLTFDAGAAVAATLAMARSGVATSVIASSLLKLRLAPEHARRPEIPPFSRCVSSLDATITALDDALRLAVDLHDGREALPLAVVAGWWATLPPLTEIPLGTANADVWTADGWAGQAGDVAATVLARLAADEAVATVEFDVVSMLYAAPTRLGALAPVVAAVLELRATCDAALSAGLLASLAATLAQAGKSAEHTDDQSHIQRVAPIVATRAQIALAEDESKAGAFQEAKFRVHLVGGDAQTAERAMAKALAFGIPRTALCASLGLAAAERMLRFDTAIDAAAHRREHWADLAWLLRIVEATRRLNVRAFQPRWLDFMLWATWQVQAGQALDASEDQRKPLAEPAVLAQSWDHGPEIARIAGHLALGDADATIANLRGYLLMGLPEAPLSSALVEATFVDAHAGGAAAAIAHVGAMTAAAETFAALGSHPHRERVFAAALRLSASRRADGEVGALAQAALDAKGNDRRVCRVPWSWLR